MSDFDKLMAILAGFEIEHRHLDDDELERLTALLHSAANGRVVLRVGVKIMAEGLFGLRGTWLFDRGRNFAGIVLDEQYRTATFSRESLVFEYFETRVVAR